MAGRKRKAINLDLVTDLRTLGGLSWNKIAEEVKVSRNKLLGEITHITY